MYLRIMSIFDVPALTNLRAMPTFSGNAGSSVPACSEVESSSVEVVVVDGCVLWHVSLLFITDLQYCRLSPGHSGHEEIRL